jgi:hypothetical protein
MVKSLTVALWAVTVQQRHERGWFSVADIDPAVARTPPVPPKRTIEAGNAMAARCTVLFLSPGAATHVAPPETDEGV